MLGFPKLHYWFSSPDLYSTITIYRPNQFSPDIFHQEFCIALDTPFAVTVANAFMYFHEKDIVEQYTQFLVLYWRFIHDIFVIWCGPRDTLLEFPGAFYYKKDRIKLTRCISNISICFQDLCLYKDIS